MTSIRISGFESRNELHEELNNLPEDTTTGLAADDLEDRRDAQIELSWLRKEVSELQTKLSIASGGVPVAPVRRSPVRYWIAGTILLAAAAALNGIVRRT